jgi:hypothetical protein
MRKKIFAIAGALLTSLYPFNLQSQTDTLPPLPVKNLIDPKVMVKVIKIENGFNYNYDLTNGSNALQNIYSFIVNVKASVMGASSPIDWEYRNLDYDTIKVASWSSEDTISDIRPNKMVSGFKIRCSGLPIIGRYWVAAWEVIPEEEGQYDPASAGVFATHLCRTTVCPAEPPSPFVAINFIDTIASYKHQSFALGWIKDQRTEQRLDRKLERAKRLLQMADTWPPGSSAFLDETEKALKEEDNECSREYGQDAVREVPRLMLDEEKLRDLIRIGRESMQGSGKDKMKKPDENRRKEQYRDALYWAAKQVMESFVREVEILNRLTEKGKKQFLTSEAYALLKYNAEYLIDQLPGKERK